MVANEIGCEPVSVPIVLKAGKKTANFVILRRSLMRDPRKPLWHRYFSQFDIGLFAGKMDPKRRKFDVSYWHEFAAIGREEKPSISFDYDCRYHPNIIGRLIVES